MNKILVVDDEPDILELLTANLQRHGYQVATAASGEEAVEKVKKERFDIALIDLKLPGIDGITALEQIKKIDPEIEAIMITGHASITSALESIKKGAYDYIEKPIIQNKLIIVIEKVLEKHQLSETVALYEISKAIFSTIEMDGLLGIIINLFMRLMKGDDASIMLFDENGELYIAIAHGLDEEIKKNTRLAIGEKIAGWVAQTRQPIILINGLKNDARFREVATRGDIKSAIVLPLIKNDQVLGILSINRTTIEENFTKLDLYKSSIFASLASLAIDNAQLYTRLLTAQSELTDTGKKLEEKDNSVLVMDSKLKATHEELRNSQQQLSHSMKLSALGRLVADMAHEVNNPLMIISGNAQLCLLEGASIDEIKNNLKVIHEECNRAKDIIQRLLKFSRPSTGERREIDINQSIETVLALIEHQLELQDIKIKRNFAEKPPLALADDKQIQEVLINLLNNARDAMPHGGIIHITTTLDRDGVEIIIKDAGTGMGEETLSKLFEPFFTTKEKGTGLGLAVCYGIIKAHNGELKFTSQKGKGTIATIFLPLQTEEA